MASCLMPCTWEAPRKSLLPPQLMDLGFFVSTLSSQMVFMRLGFMGLGFVVIGARVTVFCNLLILTRGGHILPFFFFFDSLGFFLPQLLF